MEKKIEFEDIFREGAPGYKMLYLEANVSNGPTPESLREDLENLAQEIEGKYSIPDINKIPAIAATRKAYKTFGKDPNRYRPSQEQLMRRILKGLGLYNVNALVDAGNLVSISTGCSLGIFDRDKISGDVLTLGVGKKDEPYEGIGRGILNIEGMPVIRDGVGGIGTPTSDHERTKVSENTKRISVCLHLYDSSSVSPDSVAMLLKDVLHKYCDASEIECRIINP